MTYQVWSAGMQQNDMVELTVYHFPSVVFEGCLRTSCKKKTSRTRWWLSTCNLYIMCKCSVCTKVGGLWWWTFFYTGQSSDMLFSSTSVLRCSAHSTSSGLATYTPSHNGRTRYKIQMFVAFRPSLRPYCLKEWLSAVLHYTSNYCAAPLFQNYTCLWFVLCCVFCAFMKCITL